MTLLKELLQVTGSYQMIIYSVFIVVVLLFMPKGIISFINEFAQKHAYRKELRSHAEN